jgi:ATP-dependent DNA helicase RecQ
MTLEKSLKQHFGFNSFRPLQREIIQSVLGGYDTLAILPTSSGKSLCYQFPSVIFPGLTIVISPLISLMQDQHHSLTKNGINSAVYNSTKTVVEKRDIIRRLAAGKIKLLYLSAEGIQNQELLHFLKGLKVSLIAHDESHVGSQWKDNFRVAYAKLGRLRNEFPDVPVMAVTATATPEVKQDIIDGLALKNPQVFQSSFDRPNLFIEVRRSYNLYDGLNIIFQLNDHNGSTIVYCVTKDQTISVSQYIESLGMGKCGYYHGGMKKNDRKEVQEAFISGKIKTICATTAFGMGIDKPDVRLVIHIAISKTMENMYQEIGRAGRDGKLSKCIMLYNPGDIGLWEFIIDQGTKWKDDATKEQISRKLVSRERQKEMLNKVVRYAESRICRRKAILEHFGEPHPGNCGKCDVCV